MSLLIAKKEFIEACRDKRFLITAALVNLLFVVSSFVTWGYYKKLHQEQAQGQQIARQHWEEQALKNPHAAAHFGTYIFKPVHPLSLIDDGLDKYLGVSVFIEAHKQNMARHKRIADQNELSGFPELTPIFILIYLIPLFIILVSFRSFAIEKERGTFRLLLSMGVSKFKVVLGKVCGLWFLVLVVMLPVFMLGAIFISTFSVSSDELLRYSIILIVLVIYYGIFINISVAFSVVEKNSNMVLLGLLGFWTLSTFLIPKLASNISANLNPAPSPIELQKYLGYAIANGIDGHDPVSLYAKTFQDSVLRVHNVDSVHKLPFNFSGLLMQAGEEHQTLIYARVFSRLNEIYTAQLNTQKLFSFLSPSILARMLSMKFAKTDLYAHNDFARQAEAYRIDLVRDLNHDLMLNADYGQVDYVPQNTDFFKTTKKFVYQPVSFLQTLLVATSDLFFLIFWYVLTCCFLFYAIFEL
jgi:ABC-2 type transport system permease protein